MTTPVATDDTVQGAVKYLEVFGDITAALTTYPDGTAWLFQHRLWVEMEGSAGTAAVIGRAGGWTGANTHNTLRFPRLRLDIWADPIRDAGNNIADPGEAARRIQATWGVFDTHLHRAAGGQQMWGTVRTIGCARLAEPVVEPVPEGDGLLRLQTFYGVTEG